MFAGGVADAGSPSANRSRRPDLDKQTLNRFAFTTRLAQPLILIESPRFEG
jgi:hypothetical protein